MLKHKYTSHLVRVLVLEMVERWLRSNGDGLNGLCHQGTASLVSCESGVQFPSMLVTNFHSVITKLSKLGTVDVPRGSGSSLNSTLGVKRPTGKVP